MGVRGSLLVSITSLAGWVELIGNANLLDWRGDSLFWGLTGFWARLKGGKDAVGDGGGFDGGADVVDAEDVGSGEDGGYVGGGGGVETGFGGRWVALLMTD